MLAAMTSPVGSLNFSKIVWTVLGIVLLRFFGQSLVHHRRLRHFKGPKLARFSRAWMFWQSIHARMNRAEYDSILEYGNCVSPVG